MRSKKPTHRVIDLEAQATRWSQLTDDEIAALPADEKKELIREELQALRAHISGPSIRQTINELGAARAELYMRLRP